MYFKYATIAIPARTPLRHTKDWTPASFCIPIRVRARIPAYKDGRVKATTDGWVFVHGGYAYQLEQHQEPTVRLSDVAVRRK